MNSACSDDLRRLVIGPGTKLPKEDEVADLDLAHLYTFAEREEISELQCAALAILHSQNHYHERTTTKGAIRHFLTNCKFSSGLLLYLADEAAVFLSSVNVSAMLSDFPTEYGQAIFRELLRERDGADRASKDVWGIRSIFVYVLLHACRIDRVEEAVHAAKAKPAPGPDVHDDYQSTVTVVVGSECLHFCVHKGLISKWSDYCKGALRNGFPEAESNTIDFREESVRNFSLFLDLMYEQQFFLPSLRDHRSYEEYSEGLELDLEVWKQDIDIDG